MAAEGVLITVEFEGRTSQCEITPQQADAVVQRESTPEGLLPWREREWLDEAMSLLAAALLAVSRPEVKHD